MKSKRLFSVLGSRFSVNVGFTLLELVVVMAIVGVLSSVGLNSYSTVQKRARDVIRKTDIRDVQAALEQYYSVCGYSYPAPVSGYYRSQIYCPGPSIALMPTVPVDPKTITGYPCPAVNCDTSKYTVCATLEVDLPTSFCVSNQQ